MDRIKQAIRLVLIFFILFCCAPQAVMGMQGGEREITEGDAERFLRDLLETVKNKDMDKIVGGKQDADGHGFFLMERE